jgi:hypothetical protein
MKNNIKVCYSEQVKMALLSALDSDIKNMEDLKDKQRSGTDIDVNKLPGNFHYYNDIDDMIKSYKDIKEEIEKSPDCK